MDFALINALPFLWAMILAIPAIGTLLPKFVRTWATTLLMGTLFVMLLGYFPAVQHAHESKEVLIQSFEWVPELGLTLSFYLDGLALMFALIVTGIGAGISLYAGYYFDDDEDQRRFLWLLMAFAGAMLGLVLSGNLITMFIMWELTSVTSFMLIGFKGAKLEAARFRATQAFIVTSVGALALLLGIVILGASAGSILLLDSGFTFELTEILKLDLTAHRHYEAFAILIIVGAFTKSAQFPFHFWLPGAMEAPTPASAYLHSATMVKAGIYLLARLYPSLHGDNLWLVALTGVGIFTMLMGAFFALTRDDLKAILAYSTISKLGAIVALIGLPNSEGLKAAYITIMAHALYKAALFLAAGTIDHNTGTRLLSKLGALRRYMPAMMVVVIVSALSMAGVPAFFGFVSKEVLLDAFSHSEFGGSVIVLLVAVWASVLTVTVAAIVIWELFFKPVPEGEDIHYHASSPFLTIVPSILAIGSASLGILLVPIIEPLINVMLPKEVHLHLFPTDGLANSVFQLSLGVLAAGFVLFLTRNAWLHLTKLPIPTGTGIFRMIQRGFDRAGDIALGLQAGYVRYYLIIIFGTVSVVVLSSGLLADLAAGQSILARQLVLEGTDLLKAILLFLVVAAAMLTVIFKKHIYAVLALGVIGYGVGALFLLEPAPDVALVQFLVETLATIMIILILSRISEKQRQDVIDRLWKGRTILYFYDGSGKQKPENVQREFKHLGLLRDGFIAVTVGITVFLFALTALLNRSGRESIAEYHLQNTYQDLGVTDVVGAIVADYRGMDTVVEIAVFITAALGVLTLLSRGQQRRNPLIPTDAYTYGEKTENIRRVTSLQTPFTRMVARLVLPLTFMIALAHLLKGSGAPGDGFTAGAITGLVVALWFVIFGYEETKAELTIVAPYRLMRAGLMIVVINALIPILFPGGTFAEYLNYGKMLGIVEFLDIFDLKLTSTLVFEIGVATAVFGGATAIMETIAYPTQNTLEDDL